MRQSGEGSVVIAKAGPDLRQRPFRLRPCNPIVRIIVKRALRLPQRFFFFSEAGIDESKRDWQPIRIGSNARVRGWFENLKCPGEGTARFKPTPDAVVAPD